MDSVFWLIPDLLAGRPGPDLIPWDPAALHAGGVRAVLSVNRAALVHPNDLAALSISYRCVPLSDNAPPRPGDVEHCRAALPVAYEFVRENIASARPVLVHCRSGKDRTGLFLAYYLTRAESMTPAQAIARVLEARPIALSAPGWAELAKRVLSADDT